MRKIGIEEKNEYHRNATFEFVDDDRWDFFFAFFGLQKISLKFFEDFPSSIAQQCRP